jgi:hypothetical protein
MPGGKGSSTNRRLDVGLSALMPYQRLQATVLKATVWHPLRKISPLWIPSAYAAETS